MTPRPLVSVVMPVYNRERYVKSAVDSILRQTFTDFEFIIIDDGSSDGTPAILDLVARLDNRIKLLRNPGNLGIPRSRNIGIDAARGDYIAIMDSDDLSHPQRLALQVKYLGANSACAAVGGWASEMDADGRLTGRVRMRPLRGDDMRAQLLFRCSLQNSTAMVRACIARHYRYRDQFDLSEDFDFWLRVSADHPLANLPLPLVCFRRHGSLTSRTKIERTLACQCSIFREQLAALGIEATARDLDWHLAILRFNKRLPHFDPGYLDWAQEWLQRISAANEHTRAYPRAALNRMLGCAWWDVCRYQARHTGPGAWLSLPATALGGYAVCYGVRYLSTLRYLPSAMDATRRAFAPGVMPMESADSRNPLLRLAKILKPDVLIKALSGAAVLWAFLVDDGSTAYAIHRAFYQETWEDADFTDRLVLCLGFLLSFPVNMVFSILLTLRCGKRVQSETGKSYLKQISEQLALAAGKAVPSPWYYMFELYEDARRLRALEFLYRFETKAAIYITLRKLLSDPVTTEALRDKAAFSERCLRHSVAVVAALGTMRKGRLMLRDGSSGGLPKCDLFLKPLRGAGGRGASRWTYTPDGFYLGNKGTILDEAGLIDYLAGLSHIEDYVIRTLATNHHELVELAGNALSTVRVVTCLNETGEPEVLHAVLRIASKPGVVVDNFHAGGIAAAVDLKTGILSAATDMGMQAGSCWWDHHPISGVAITGRVLPMWEEVIMLAGRAHGIFLDHVAIGWDIAICEQGPLLVEGNKSPDLDIIQRVGREPLGNSRFGQLLLFHIQRAHVGRAACLSTRSVCSEATVTENSIMIETSAVELIEVAATTTAPVFEIGPSTDLSSSALRESALATLESGGIIYLPRGGFELTERERALILDAAVTLPTRRERKSRNGRPTVIYDPLREHILRARMPKPGRQELEALMRRYSYWTAALLAELFPAYAGKLVRDRLTYRPCERIDTQGLHVDASYGRPTEGRGMLRVFCNINPSGQARTWRIGEPFEPFARRFLPTAKPPRTSRIEGLLASLGVTRGRRTAYDRLMADIRGQAKKDKNYQRTAPQRTLSFPPGAVWIAITDLVLHGALTGQHSLDQTYFLPPDVMRTPANSSLKILERLGSRPLI